MAMPDADSRRTLIDWLRRSVGTNGRFIEANVDAVILSLREAHRCRRMPSVLAHSTTEAV